MVRTAPTVDDAGAPIASTPRPGRRVSKRAAESTGPIKTPAYHPKPDWPWPVRPYQQAAYDAFQAGRRRQLLVWHRRAGKDIYAMSLARIESQKRVGGYVHFFPYHVQAKRAIWNGVDPRLGVRFIDHAFGDLTVATNKTDMLLDFENGSTWQMLGSDNYDRVVGSNIVGVVFSEWALCDPRAWDYIRPILRENNGWAVFITTYRGRNHAWRMAQAVKDNPTWYFDLRTVDDTRDAAGNPILTAEDIDLDRREGMPEALIRQEYYCDPDAALDGAIYAGAVAWIAQDETRCHAQWDPARPVLATWDWQHWPACASVCYTQTGEIPAILTSETLNFPTVAECVAAARNHPWPLVHALNAADAAMLDPLADAGVHAHVLPDRDVRQVQRIAQNYLARATIARDACAHLIDSLYGYVCKSAAGETDGEQMFLPRPELSWHGREARALECAALYDADIGGGWSRDPSYQAFDRRRI